MLSEYCRALTDRQLENLLDWNVSRLPGARPGSVVHYSARQALTAIENERRRRSGEAVKRARKTRSKAVNASSA